MKDGIHLPFAFPYQKQAHFARSLLIIILLPAPSGTVISSDYYCIAGLAPERE